MIKEGAAFGNLGAELNFYKLYNPNTASWLYTDSQQETINAGNYGFVNTGIIGNIMPYQTQTCNSGCYLATIPLYRFRYAVTWMFTTSASEYNALASGGWTYEGISGYVPVGQ